MSNKNKRVIVAMSGGVDSSAAALLLKEQGYDVIGVTMHLWQGEGGSYYENEDACCGYSAVYDARRVAEVLGIPHYVINFKEEFKKYVADYFAEEYLNGRTPNPCIACNRYIKWEALLQRSLDLGAEYLATGHYARITSLPSGRLAVYRAAYENKDQSYALFSLTQEQLTRTLFPAGEYSKDEIRRIAAEAGLPTAQKSESQDICFVPDGDCAGFIERYTGKASVPGDFVNKNGTVLGRHKGITHYTVGQRRGLNLAVGKKVFVTSINAAENEVVIGSDADLLSYRLKAGSLNFMSLTEQEINDNIMQNIPMELEAKIRYNMKPIPCRIESCEGGTAVISFNEPVRAVTPGQAAVVYSGGAIVMGGTIIE